MKAPYFTILIDTYNYGQYIEEAVSSVLAQDFPPEQREILVVDDGSTDDTAERLRKFGDAIRVLRKPNGGQASAFNYGFEHARGEVIALLDADDVWLPGKLGRVYEAFERNPTAGMIYHRIYLWSGANETAEDSYFIPISGRVAESRKRLLQYPMVGTSCLAFRRETLKELMPIPESLLSQADAYLTALVIFVAPVTAVPEFLGKYRLHGANLFQIDEKQASANQIKYRIAMRGMLLRHIQLGLRTRGYNLHAPDIRDYLKQWTKAQERDGFVLTAPGRWKYFCHLLDHPRTYGAIMTPRHRAYSYVRAFAALFLGYHHLHLLDDARERRKGKTSSSPAESAAAEEERTAAAKS